MSKITSFFDSYTKYVCICQKWHYFLTITLSMYVYVKNYIIFWAVTLNMYVYNSILQYISRKLVQILVPGFNIWSKNQNGYLPVYLMVHTRQNNARVKDKMDGTILNNIKERQCKIIIVFFLTDVTVIVQMERESLVKNGLTKLMIWLVVSLIRWF